MSVGQAEISQYVESIWASLLGLMVRPDDSAPPPPRTSCLTGCIQITGAWEGAVTLDIPWALSRQAAAIMFQAGPDDEVPLDQVQDAVGELTNMIGGNLKALLPGPCYLTLPAVADGTDYALRVLGSKVVSQATFVCQDQPFVVTVIERDRSGASD